MSIVPDDVDDHNETDEEIVGDLESKQMIPKSKTNSDSKASSSKQHNNYSSQSVEQAFEELMNR